MNDARSCTMRCLIFHHVQFAVLYYGSRAATRNSYNRVFLYLSVFLCLSSSCGRWLRSWKLVFIRRGISAGGRRTRLQLSHRLPVFNAV